jgi:predicted RNase H-like HicB family nuclease
VVLHIVLEDGEDGLVLANVPALPGCHTQGSTREEALSNAEEAIRGWLESQDAAEAAPNREVVAIAV